MEKFPIDIVIKSDNGYFFKLRQEYRTTYKINGVDLRPANISGWFISDDIPKTVNSMLSVSKPKVWKLKPKYDKPGSNLEKETVFEKDEDGDYPNESLFYEVEYSDVIESKLLEVEIKDIIEEDVKNPILFDGHASGYGKDIRKIRPHPSLTHAFLYPEIQLSTKPCAVSGDELYAITRLHVKQNIDQKYAEITSDYDFCFTVQKKLAIVPITRSYDARTGRQRTPRMKTYTISDRKITVFEATPPRSNYRGYTPLSGISANNHEELAQRVNSFLDKLMSIINEPLESCKECDGTGVKEPSKLNEY